MNKKTSLPLLLPVVLAALAALPSLSGQSPALPPSNLTPSAPEPASSPTPDPEHPVSSVPGETKDQRDARMAWWRDAKFGMFVHWGVYSVPAGRYGAKNTYGEWIMNSAKIPVAEYRGYAKQFNPVKFDPAKFVAAAKSAGMKYIVITAKHHDGFAMFDTKASDWSIMRATPYGSESMMDRAMVSLGLKQPRDPLKALAEECRKQGMRLGFYYSQAQDWNNGGSAAHGGNWDKAQDRDMDEYIDKVAVPQVRELLTNYGPDTPAVLWWDTPTGMNLERATKLHDAVRELRPGLIQNNRLFSGKELREKGIGTFLGDTETPEQYVPPQGYPGRDWETCMTMNRHWGFNADDQEWKSPETLIRNLCDIASKGGNYLLNVGPNAEGEIPKESLKRLAEVGEWMKVNGEAIYGTGPTPFTILQGSYSPTQKAKDGKPKFLPEWKWRATTKPGHVYLTVFEWPGNGSFTVPALTQKITRASLLAAPSAALTVIQDDAGTTVNGLPAKAPDAVASVIDLQY